jgi:hypothetical protein
VGARQRLRLDRRLAHPPGRTYFGPREILDDPEGSAELAWLDRHSFKHSWHRPDLVGFLSDRAIAIEVEVELAPKSKPRLDAILQLHQGWIVSRRTDAVIYICSDQEGRRRVERAGERIGLHRADRRFRIALLDTIKEQTLARYEQKRVDQAAAA